MLTITIIENRKGFRPIVEDRAAKRAYVCPTYLDTKRDALKVAKDAAPQLGDFSTATIEHVVREKFSYI